MSSMKRWADDHGEGVDILYKDWGHEARNAYCELCGELYYIDELEEGLCVSCWADAYADDMNQGGAGG